MRHLASWTIAITYSYAILLGIFAFSYDSRTGWIGRRSSITVYCILVNLMTLGMLPVIVTSIKLHAAHGQLELHYQMFLIVTLLRIICVVSLVAVNWMRRQEFLENYTKLALYRKRFLNKWSLNEQQQKTLDLQICLKLLLSIISEVMQSLATIKIMSDKFDVHNPMILMVLSLLGTVLNVMTCNFYYVTASNNALFGVINMHLKVCLNNVANLFRWQHAKRIKPGFLMHQCCQLSDLLDDLSAFHYELQNLIDRINYMYYVQGCCVLFIFYINNIGFIYFGYMLLRQQDVWSLIDGKTAILTGITLLFYYADLRMILWVILDMIDVVSAPGLLLQTRQPWLPTLDERLERSLKNFALKMSALPMEKSLLYLFDFTRPMVFATLVSTVSNAIVIMQIDYEYSRNN